MCPVLAHSAISGKPKKQFLDFPGEKRLVSFNKTTTLQPSWCDFSLGKEPLRNNSDLLFASHFYLFPCLLTDLFSSLWWLQQAAASNVTSKLLARWAALLHQGMAKTEELLLLGQGGCLAPWVPAQSRVSTRGAEGASLGCTHAKEDSELSQTCRDRSLQPIF